MAADARTFLVRPHHHRHGIPADDALDLPLQLAVAGIRGLLIGRDGVDIGRGGAGGEGHAAAKGLLLEPLQEELGPLGSLGLADVVEGLEPLGGFPRVVVAGQGGEYSVW